jgi:hypothetical protein
MRGIGIAWNFFVVSFALANLREKAYKAILGVWALLWGGIAMQRFVFVGTLLLFINSLGWPQSLDSANKVGKPSSPSPTLPAIVPLRVSRTVQIPVEYEHGVTARHCDTRGRVYARFMSAKSSFNVVRFSDNLAPEQVFTLRDTPTELIGYSVLDYAPGTDGSLVATAFSRAPAAENRYVVLHFGDDGQFKHSFGVPFKPQKVALFQNGNLLILSATDAKVSKEQELWSVGIYKTDGSLISNVVLTPSDFSVQTNSDRSKKESGAADLGDEALDTLQLFSSGNGNIYGVILSSLVSKSSSDHSLTLAEFAPSGEVTYYRFPELPDHELFRFAVTERSFIAFRAVRDPSGDDVQTIELDELILDRNNHNLSLVGRYSIFAGLQCATTGRIVATRPDERPGFYDFVLYELP